jgi:hypothetical protein
VIVEGTGEDKDRVEEGDAECIDSDVGMDKDLDVVDQSAAAAVAVADNDGDEEEEEEDERHHRQVAQMQVFPSLIDIHYAEY